MDLFPCRQFTSYRLLCIDPGSHKTGVSLFEVDLLTSNIVSIKTWTINVDKLVEIPGFPSDFVGEKFSRFYRLREEFKRILRENEVDCVCYEGPFMNVKQPNAYGPLVSVMTLVMDAAFEHNLGMPFFTVQPQQTKKAVGVAGKKGKEVMLAALKKFDNVVELLRKENIELDDLDDNAIDSVAVGLAALKLYVYKEKDYEQFLPKR